MFYLKQPGTVIDLYISNILYLFITVTLPKFSIPIYMNTIFSLDIFPELIRFSPLNTFLLNFVLKRLKEFNGYSLVES